MIDTGVDVGPHLDAPGLKASILGAVRELVPEGHRVVIVGVASKDGAITFGGAARVGEHWQIEGDLTKPKGSPIEGRLMFVASW